MERPWPLNVPSQSPVCDSFDKKGLETSKEDGISVSSGHPDSQPHTPDPNQGFISPSSTYLFDKKSSSADPFADGATYPYANNNNNNNGFDDWPPPPPPPSMPHMMPSQRYTRHPVMRFWVWELLALFVAIGLMVAKISILATFEGHELPKWPFSINLNTLIALLSMVQRAALLLVIAEIVGQAKWTWFTHHSRPLMHLQDFDDAGRSVLGALRLIFISAWNSGPIGTKCLILIAAWITVLSFGISPFTQQAFNSASCRRLVSSSNSTVPVVNYVPGSSSFYRIGAGMWEVDVDMKGAMLNGLTHPDGLHTKVQPHCPTGDCVFPDYGTGVTYSSIGMCSRCLDASGLVRAPDEGGNMTLGDGTYLNFGPSQPYLNVQSSNLSYARSLFTEEFSAAARSAILNISIMAVSEAPCTNHSGTITCPRDWSKDSYAGNADVVAASCTLYPCLESYNGSVKGGVLEEEVVLREPATLLVERLPEEEEEMYIPVTTNYTAFRSPCTLDNGTWYTASNISEAPATSGRTFGNVTLNGVNTTVPEECLYKLYGVYGSAVGSFLGEMLSGSCLYNNMQAGYLNCVDSWWLSPFYNSRNASFSTLSAQLEGLTSAMTQKFRETGLGPYGDQDHSPSPAGESRGEVYETTVCTTLDWRWLLLPIFLTVATVFLLVWMVLRNLYWDLRQPVWKSSILPLLFYGLKDDRYLPQGVSTKPTPRLANLKEVETMSRNMHAQYRNGGMDPDPGFYRQPREGDVR